MKRGDLHTVFISVGANLGDKIANCRFGIARLTALPGVTACTTSPFYRTAPVDYFDQDWFVNAAVRIATHLAPLELLEQIGTIQKQAGREDQKIRFGPRVLDLDIIFYDSQVVRSPQLEIPHPRMHKRRFVLQPICDIDPKFIHPLQGQPVQMLLDQLDDDEQEIYRIDD
ncbi:MAG: 2-amino-4-hydroxy-6-hydroxymethyldihydropteridine diphosphokinase [Desulfobacterales bacterium]|nr:2-amino-4-hydroxy-6-hydroxymethyldihydropteridine diphosphokinase [Desulfobacterales bacterium]